MTEGSPARVIQGYKANSVNDVIDTTESVVCRMHLGSSSAAFTRSGFELEEQGEAAPDILSMCPHSLIDYDKLLTARAHTAPDEGSRRPARSSVAQIAPNGEKQAALQPKSAHISPTQACVGW